MTCLKAKIGLTVLLGLFAMSMTAGSYDPVENLAKNVVKWFDKNKDGSISRDEWTSTSSPFGKWDKNKDGSLDLSEVKAIVQAELASEQGKGQSDLNKLKQRLKNSLKRPAKKPFKKKQRRTTEPV